MSQEAAQKSVFSSCKTATLSKSEQCCSSFQKRQENLLMLQTLGPGGSWWRLYLALWQSDFGACWALHSLAALGRCPYLLQPQPFELFPADSAQTPLISLPEARKPGSPPWLGTSLRALKSDPQTSSMLAPLLGIFQPGFLCLLPITLGP